MSLLNRNPNDRYKVSVVSDKDKASITKPKSKLRRVTSGMFTKAFSGILVAIMVFLGLIGGAAPAAAVDEGLIGNLFTSAIEGMACSQGNYYYEVKTRTMDTKTGEGIEPRFQTGFEKYGMTGTSWSVWLGPVDQEGMDDAGRKGGKSIVDQAGGEKNNGGIDYWGDSVKGDENLYPSFYNTKDACIALMPAGTTGMANSIFSVSKFFTFLSNTAFQLAYEESSSLPAKFAPVLESIIGKLYGAIYVEFLAAVLSIAALHSAYTGFKRQATKFSVDIVYRIALYTLTLAAIASPLAVPNFMDRAVSNVNQGIMTATTSSAPEAGSGDICYVAPVEATQESTGSGGVIAENVQISQGQKDRARYTVRSVQCNLWKSFVYEPWVEGQFGTDLESVNAGWPSVGNIGNPLEGTNVGDGVAVAGQDIKNDWPLTYLNARVMPDASTPESEILIQKRTQLNVAAAQLHTDTPNRVFSGAESQDRVAQAAMASLGSIASSLLIVIISLSMMMLQLGGHLLWVLSPIFFLVGLETSRGRKILLGFLEIILGLALKRVLLGLVLGVMILFYQAILAADMTYIVTQLVIIALTIGVFTHWGPILGAFGKVNIGGDGKVEAVGQQAEAQFAAGRRDVALAGGALLGIAGTKSPSVGSAARSLSKTSATPEPTNKGAGSKPNSQTEQHSSRVSNSPASDSKFSSSQSESGPTNKGAGDRPAESHNSSTGDEPANEPSNDGAGERATESHEPTSEKDTVQENRPAFDPEGPADHNWAPSGYSKQEETPGFVKAKLNAASVRRAENQRNKEALLREGYKSKTSELPSMATKAVVSGLAMATVSGRPIDGVLGATGSVRRSKDQIKLDNASIKTSLEREVEADKAKAARERKNPPIAPKPVKPLSDEESMKQAKESTSKAPKSSFTPYAADKPAENRPTPPAKAPAKAPAKSPAKALAKAPVPPKAGKPLPDKPAGKSTGTGAGSRPA